MLRLSTLLHTTTSLHPDGMAHAQQEAERKHWRVSRSPLLCSRIALWGHASQDLDEVHSQNVEDDFRDYLCESAVLANQNEIVTIDIH